MIGSPLTHLLNRIDGATNKTVIDGMLSANGQVYVFNPQGIIFGKTAQVDIRGFGDTSVSNTLVLVDGRRTNQIDISGVDWAQIDVNSIDRIEVTRGGQSVLYGDNAAGGVINIITYFFNW